MARGDGFARPGRRGVRAGWRLRPGPIQPTPVFDALGLSPIVGHLLAKRGVETEQGAKRFLSPALDDLAPPSLLPDADRAAERMARAVRGGEKILVYGDYDADGITAAALMVRTLRVLGADVGYFLPHRQKHGYGLNIAAVEAAAGNGVDLIVTVDSGSSAVSETARAKELGIDVVVTDHHEAFGAQPDVVAHVNPKRAGNDCRDLAYLAGVGVAYKVCEALLTVLNQPTAGYRERSLDLVAVGTIADVAPLVGENRALTKLGLGVLAKTRKIGLLALATEAGLDISRVRARTVSMTIAPRLNAAGRMDDPEIALKLLLTKDSAEGWRLAHALEISNARRREEQDRCYAEAEEIVGRTLDPAQRAIVVASEGWNVGVIGIIASKLSETFCLPSFVVVLDGQAGRGSARSPAGLNVVDALRACSEHLTAFGGHERAGGFEIAASKMGAFRDCLLAYAANAYPSDAPEAGMDIDLALAIGDITLDLARQIRDLEPFGEGNPQPVFLVEDAIVREIDQVGAGEHVLLRVAASGSKGQHTIQAMAFGFANEMAYLRPGDHVDLCVALSVDEYGYGGWAEPRMIVRDFYHTRGR
jgi:single-stranded-DNA-specific exonuclease